MNKFLLEIVFSDGVLLNLEIFHDDLNREIFHLAFALKQTDHVMSVRLRQKTNGYEEIRLEP